METYVLPDELRTAVDDIRSWLCQPGRMPDCARKAARSLVELVFHDLSLIGSVVEYFVRPSSGGTFAGRLPLAGQFAFAMARTEHAKREATCSIERLVVERFCADR